MNHKALGHADVLVEGRKRPQLRIVPGHVPKLIARLSGKNTLIEEQVHIGIEIAALQRSAPIVVTRNYRPGVAVEDRERIVARQGYGKAAHITEYPANAPASHHLADEA